MRIYFIMPLIIADIRAEWGAVLSVSYGDVKVSGW